MTVSAYQLAELRRMVNEPSVTTYSDALLTLIVESYPMIDELGTNPYYYQKVGSTPVRVDNTDWIPTYDLNAAAAQIWREKASTVAGRFDFTADGGTYTQSQEYVHADAMSRFFLARSSSRTIHQTATDVSTTQQPIWVGNLPEPN